MSLKPQPDRPAVVVPALPTWGILAEPGETVSSIRLECADGAYSYPYHTLTRWVLRAAQPENLVIEAGPDKVTVRGRKLEEVRDGLDSGRLRVIRIVEERYLNSGTGGVIVTDLKIERLQPKD